MLKDATFLLSFLVLVVLALIHHSGMALYWYYTFPPLDLITHFFGGLWVALVALWFIFRSGYIRTISFSNKNATLVALVTIFVVGVSWELFELWTGIIIKEGYVVDTILDGVMDVLGALVGLFFFITKQKTPPRGGVDESISLSQ